MNDLIEGNKNELTQEDIMIQVLQTQKKQNIAIGELREDVRDLQDKQRIDPILDSYIGRIRRQRIVECLGGKKSQAYNHHNPEGSQYKRFSSQVFTEAGRDFNSFFKIRTYGELLAKDYDKAVEYWQSWVPSHNTQQEIKQLNNQLTLLDAN